MPKRRRQDLAGLSYRGLEALRPDDGLFVAVLAVFFAWFPALW